MVRFRRQAIVCLDVLVEKQHTAASFTYFIRLNRATIDVNSILLTFMEDSASFRQLIHYRHVSVPRCDQNVT